MKTPKGMVRARKNRGSNEALRRFCVLTINGRLLDRAELAESLLAKCENAGRDLIARLGGEGTLPVEADALIEVLALIAGEREKKI